MNEKKVITVLFTRYDSAVSNFIYLISGKGYTHVSLALDEQNEYYYSFNVRGFRKEYPQKHKWRSGKSMGIKLEVPQEDFDKMERKIGEMERERDKFHYSRLGVLFCLLHIPCKLQNRYFCSQFVAEILKLSDDVFLDRNATLYLPNQLLKELCGQNCLKEIICNPI